MWGERGKEEEESLYDHTHNPIPLTLHRLYLNNVSIDCPRSEGRVTAVWLETAPGEIQNAAVEIVLS